MLSPRRDSPWEVVDHKHVAQVPSFFDDPDVEISSISSHDVSQTFTFDRPIWSTPSTSQPPSPTASPRSKRERLRSKLHLHRKSSRSSSESASSRRFSSYSTSSRSSSSTLSDLDDSDPEHAYRAVSTWSRDFSPAQMKEALIFARSQLINSTEFKRMGGNILFFEGWELTKLRKGSQHRLEIRYTGRPAMAVYKSSPLSTAPPFMDILADAW